MSTRVLIVRDHAQAAEAAREGAGVLAAGGLVGFPTETVYGVGALASDAGAMGRLRELKSRPANPFSVHVAKPADVERYVRNVPPAARRLMKKGWPGPLTVILPVGGKLADSRLAKLGMYDVLCKDDMIGLRCPDCLVARLMLEDAPEPVVAPSANMAGRPSPGTAEDVLKDMDDRIDLLIDAGSTRYGKDSTIVKFADNGDWSIPRVGVVDARMVRALMRWSMLFVCTGNTCRSPIAAGLARKLAAERRGCDVSELKSHGVEISSAGLYAVGGGVTPEAIEAARRLGADISHHRTRKATGELINGADVVFCMTDEHVRETLRRAPSAAGKVHKLDPVGDIPDPIGSGVEVYRDAAERIARAIARISEEGLL